MDSEKKKKKRREPNACFLFVCLFLDCQKWGRAVLTVPSLTYLPEALVTGRDVAVRAVLTAASIVDGRAPCVPGRAKPLTGRPLLDMGLPENEPKRINVSVEVQR